MSDDVLAWSLHDERWEKVPTVEGINSHERMQELSDARERNEERLRR